MSRSPRTWTVVFALLTTGLAPAFSRPAEGSSPPPIRPLRTGGLAADAAAIILSGQQGGDLPIAALAAPKPRAEGGLSVPISIEIDAGVLFDFETTQADESEPERLEIIVYMLGADGVQIQDSLLQAYAIDAERLAESRRGLRFVTELDLPRPPGTARVMVRLEQREALGVLSVPIDGATPQAAMPATSGPAASGEASQTELPSGQVSAEQAADGPTGPEAGAAQVGPAVATTGLAAAGASAAAPRLTPPLMPGGEGWLRLPWILPTGVLPPLPEPFASQALASKAVLIRGSALEFDVLASGLDAIDSQLTLELTGADGRLSAQIGAELKSYSAPLEDGWRQIRIAARTEDLPLGSYGLSAILTSAGEQHRSPPLQVLIIGEFQLGSSDEGEKSPDAWPWMVARLTAPQGPTLASGRASRSAVDHRQLTDGLDEVFAQLAAGDKTSARRRHLRLALGVADDHGSLGLKAMGKEEFERAKAMAELSDEEIESGRANRRAAEAVLPLVALNLELYRETRLLGRTLISTHARFMTLRLIELYLATSLNPGLARRTAASLLVSLAGELQLADMVYFSERMFKKALSYDAEQTTALLALGMTYHLIGDTQRARDSFQALLAVDADHVEGNLRMARLETMEGRTKRARKLLARAVRGHGPPWARAVAYQELARLDIDDGEIDRAIGTLERAVSELPDQPRLLILLAFAHDAKAASAEAREVLARAGAVADSRPSPRRRFGDWSRESFVRNDRQVVERVDQTMPVFAERWPVAQKIREEER